jgi:glutamyl-tRNA reductase
VGVDLARKIFGSLEGKRVLLVGAGKMSELAARHLMQHGATSFLVANRTHARAVELAQRFNGRALRFEDLHAMADQADIILTSTGSENFIFCREHGQQFLQRRKNRPMFFIDIAVPRDVDPEMNKVDGVFLYDIDDLQSVASSNMSDRSREARDAESIIAVEVERFERRSASLDIVPALVVLQKAVEGMRQAELRKAASRLQTLTPDQLAAVEAVTRGLANKFLHLPMQALKAAALEGDSATVEALREAFHLTEPQSVSAAAPVPAPSSPALAEEPVLEPAVVGDKVSRGKG